MFNVTHIDHLVLTVKNINVSVDFYVHVLGMHTIQFGEDRSALQFGQQKINLHEVGNEFEPKAQNATPGSADLCLITDTKLAQAIEHVQNRKIEIIEGPVERTGATGKLLSFYIHDPDFNLIAISNTL